MNEDQGSVKVKLDSISLEIYAHIKLFGSVTAAAAATHVVIQTDRSDNIF